MRPSGISSPDTALMQNTNIHRVGISKILSDDRKDVPFKMRSFTQKRQFTTGLLEAAGQFRRTGVQMKLTRDLPGASRTSGLISGDGAVDNIVQIFINLKNSGQRRHFPVFSI